MAGDYCPVAFEEAPELLFDFQMVGVERHGECGGERFGCRGGDGAVRQARRAFYSLLTAFYSLLRPLGGPFKACFVALGGYVNQTGNPCYDSSNEKCGRLEFKLKLG